MRIKGRNIELKFASEQDRRKIYNWLCQSDLTPAMLGPPLYPDLSIPSWEEFCQDYGHSYFCQRGNGKGRVFIIMANHEEVGTVGYDLLDPVKNRVVLDIWMRSEAFCGRGYGSDALQTLCNYLHQTYAIHHFIISPSLRNNRAIAAYQKAGFKVVKTLSKKEQEQEFGMAEYDDNVLMVKILGKK